MRYHVLAIALVVCIICPGRADATVIFSENNFNQYWQETTYTWGNGGYQTTTDQTSGGNPGAYWSFHIRLNAANPNDRSTVYGFHGYHVNTYDPQTAGAIESIDYSQDAVMLTNNEARFGPAVRQNGNMFIYAGWIVDASTWTHEAVSGLTAASFELVDNPSVHPDFSSSGSPLEVGFFTGASTGIGNEGSSVDGGIDNWNFVIHQIPEPASLLIMTIGGLLIARRRCR